MSVPLALFLLVVLLAGNAFFVGAEFATITARRDRLEALLASGVTRARLVLRAREQLSLLIAGAQLGVTLCSLGLGALGEPVVAHLLERPFEAFDIEGAAVGAVAFTVALGVVVTLHTVLGEMVPKNLAIAGPERSALWLVPAHFAFCAAMGPLLDLFTVVARLVLRVFGIRVRDEVDSGYTPGELAVMISESRREGFLDDSETRRLTATLSSAGRTVTEVLVPVDRLISLPVGTTVKAVEEAVAATGFSRFPLRRPDGELAGYLHVKDVLQEAATPEARVAAGRVRTLPEVRREARLDEAMAALRRAGSHLGRVVDGEGHTVGVVALEDLVEEYVGTVRDATHVRRAPPRAS